MGVLSTLLWPWEEEEQPQRGHPEAAAALRMSSPAESMQGNPGAEPGPGQRAQPQRQRSPRAAWEPRENTHPVPITAPGKGSAGENLCITLKRFSSSE